MERRNQSAHVLIGRKREPGILQVRSFRGAGCDTDQRLVVGKLGTAGK